jgi:pyruvate formate lyase activating enzyme
LALKKAENRIMRICWETNGSVDPSLLDEMIELSMVSGGCLKFDLKARHDGIHRTLCGVSNEQTLTNFEKAAERIRERREPPLLIASTLLVPGYVDEEEVGAIARFIAEIDPEIPYSLLAFYPHFYLNDLPTTSMIQAEKCHKKAKEAGLRRVRVGNVHLLSER